MDPILITLVASVLGGGSIVGLISLWLKERRSNKADRKQDDANNLVSEERIVALVVKSMQEQRDGALERLRIAENKIDMLELEIQGLRMAQGRDPFPRWLVDLTGSYIYINQAFEDQFLRPVGKRAQDLIGKRHEDFWPDEIATKLHLLDAEARRRPDGRAKAILVYKGQSLTVYKIPVRHLGTGAIMAQEGWITDVEV